MTRILMPLPCSDFDPTESAVPWSILTNLGHTVIFATPEGVPASADPVMVTGKGLGLMAPLLMADANGLNAYAKMVQCPAFIKPIGYADITEKSFDALLLPGGHAPGMKVYLESPVLQARVAEFFASKKPIAAICHGVLLAARSRNAAGVSVLRGRKTTGLTHMLELSGWALTCLWMGNYYRTYPQTLQAEVQGVLADGRDFLPGPLALKRDRSDNLQPGFCVRDENFLSARWPGDSHRFATEFAEMLSE